MDTGINVVQVAELEGLINLFFNGSLFLVLVLYVVFSLIIVRQVFLMSNVIISGINKFVKLFAVLHFIFSILVFIFILFILII